MTSTIPKPLMKKNICIRRLSQEPVKGAEEREASIAVVKKRSFAPNFRIFFALLPDMKRILQWIRPKGNTRSRVFSGYAAA